MPSHYAVNLREALSRVSSVSQLCREIGLNRQQMNKYVAGINEPSPYNRHRIARYFQVRVAEFDLPPTEFERLIDLRFGLGGPDREVVLPEEFRRSFTTPDKDLSRFVGYWRCYIRSGSWPGYLLCYILRIYRSGAWFQSQSVGRYRDPDTQKLYLMKSHGVLTMQADGIFVLERERIGLPKLSATILEPSYRTSGVLMAGITVDMPFHVPRRALALRTVFVFAGMAPEPRELLASSAVLRPEARQIDPRVRRLLEEPVPTR